MLDHITEADHITGVLRCPAQVPSGVLNRGEAAALAGGLQRMPSGNIYDGFPCIRIGDFVLPSSMDLRAYLTASFTTFGHSAPASQPDAHQQLLSVRSLVSSSCQRWTALREMQVDEATRMSHGTACLHDAFCRI